MHCHITISTLEEEIAAMSIPSDNPPFSYALSDDKSELNIVLHESEQRWSAEDVMNVIRFFAIQRAQMTPEFPAEVAKCHPLEIFQTDAYTIAQHPETGTAQVFLRMPGIGWALAEFHPEDCEKLSQALARSIQEKPSTSH
jgi:hypothetical protein